MLPCNWQLTICGINHKTSTIEEREPLQIGHEETAQANAILCNIDGVLEATVLSTCNRVEILMVADHTQSAVDTALMFISKFKGIPVDQFEQALYIRQGDDAVRHVFRVAASLDSMVVGEPQILGQIKEAYRAATQKKTSGVILNRMLHRTFFVAKRVRTETGIGDHAVSISYAAIELGRKIFGSMEGKHVLLIGAGEMAELAVEHLIRHRAGDILVANRTFETGVRLARRFNGKAIKFKEIVDTLVQVDIIISSTGSPDFIIKRNHIKGLMRKRRNRPLFFIDIAVPRDIDPEINRTDNAYVYDIDDLKGVIEENIEDREKEAVKAQRMIDAAVIRFRQWYESLSAVPTIVALRKKLDTIANTEVKKTVQSLKHLSQKDRQAIQRMADAMMNRILHDPVLFLKQDGCHGDKSIYLDITRKLFKLDDE